MACKYQARYTWKSMMYRCYRKSNSDFRYYGGRGITVCERWYVFANFLADMGERPNGMTIDRIDHNGDYCPENCRWATRLQQSCNVRSNRLIEFNGELLPMAHVAARIGMDKTTFRMRLEAGWPVEKAISQPVRTHTWRSR